MVQGEREALRTAAGLRFNTLKTFGPDEMTSLGPARRGSYERYAASSRDLFGDKAMHGVP